MKLSILIPTFHYDCSQLVIALHKQLPSDGEIIVMDDGSNECTLTNKLESLSKLDRTKIFFNPENVGRAKIRNKLADEAQGDWLLFIDSDALVDSSDYIERYLQECKNGDVICGGTKSPGKCPKQSVSLRYKYERNYWAKHDALQRNKSAYASFTTFNFMIKRNVFMDIRFREEISEYGHEDTLFGLDLKEKKYKVFHIENPLIHNGLEANKEFLEKAETALRTLTLLPTESRQHVTISRYGDICIKRGMSKIVNAIFKRSKSWWTTNLLSANPSLNIFKAYKLCYYVWYSTHNKA